MKPFVPYDDESLTQLRASLRLPQEEWYSQLFNCPPPKRNWYDGINGFVYRNWKFPLDCYNEVRYFIQRGYRGYSDRDAWAFDDYLAKVISKGVEHLRLIKHGWPGDPMTEEEWDRILKDIVEGFELYMTQENLFFEDCRSESLSNEDINNRAKERIDKINAAMEYFNKYYCHLWD
jgi:hypothetical protein